MTEAQAIELMLERWDTQWRILQPTVPFSLDNESFDSVDTWVRVTIRHTISRQISHGGTGTRRFVHQGNIWVQLFGPADKGRKAIANLITDVKTVLDSISLTSPVPNDDDLTTSAATPGDETTEGRWFIETKLIPFRYYEMR